MASYLLHSAVWRNTYRFDYTVSTVWQASNVNFRLQFPIDRCKKTFWAGDTHNSLLTYLHADAVFQFFHWYLQNPILAYQTYKLYKNTSKFFLFFFCTKNTISIHTPNCTWKVLCNLSDQLMVMVLSWKFVQHTNNNKNKIAYYIVNKEYKAKVSKYNHSFAMHPLSEQVFA